MKLRFVYTETDVNPLDITGEIINGFDLSPIQNGDLFVGNTDTKTAGIYFAERDALGYLWVTLAQQGSPGHWKVSDWIDFQDLDYETIYIKSMNQPSEDKPVWAKALNGGVVYV